MLQGFGLDSARAKWGGALIGRINPIFNGYEFPSSRKIEEGFGCFIRLRNRICIFGIIKIRSTNQKGFDMGMVGLIWLLADTGKSKQIQGINIVCDLISSKQIFSMSIVCLAENLVLALLLCCCSPLGYLGGQAVWVESWNKTGLFCYWLEWCLGQVLSLYSYLVFDILWKQGKNEWPHRFIFCGFIWYYCGELRYRVSLRVHGFMVSEVALSSRKSWWKPHIQESVDVGLFMFHCSILYLIIWPLFVVMCGRELVVSWHVLGWLEVYLNAQICVGGKFVSLGTGSGYMMGFMLVIGLGLIGVWLMVLPTGLGYGGGVYKSHVRHWRFGLSLQVRRWRFKWQAREWGLTMYGCCFHKVGVHWYSLGDNVNLKFCIWWEFGDCAETQGVRIYGSIIWLLWQQGLVLHEIVYWFYWVCLESVSRLTYLFNSFSLYASEFSLKFKKMKVKF